MNRSLKFGLIVVLILAVIWFATRIEQTPSTEQRMPTDRTGGMPAQLRVGDVANQAIQTLAERVPFVEMKEAKYEIDYVALARSRENLPFEFRGGGTSGRIIDRQGRVLMDSGKEIGILGVEVGPDKEHVLVKGGDAVNFVLNPATGLKLKLPLTPPGANMLGFGWHWIGKTKLLGDSGVQAFNAKGTPINCCEGHNVAQTKLYVYDVTTQKLAEVNMPSKVTQPVVNVVDVSSDGHVHLVHEVPHVGTQQDLGWFKVDPEK
ncbi:MAG: hypothetical protein RIS79_2625 [Verrucomicrobiota bacterium]|jgi:hypothetical protein